MVAVTDNARAAFKKIYQEQSDSRPIFKITSLGFG
jgi:hypothetical protein